MPNITTRQYRILSDHMDIYRFMVELYERDWRNGVPAPFLEYALSCTWMDKSRTYQNRIWLDGDQIVGFCFTEAPVTDVYFSLRPGYEFLAPEMVAYASAHMPGDSGARQLVLFQGQRALIEAAQGAGYEKTGEKVDMIYDFSRPLDYPLPEGFRLVPPGAFDPEKISLCCWKGFGHEAEEGPWNGDSRSTLQCCAAPHAAMEHIAVIEDQRGEYACFAGMWWVPENGLAYMEPLCTVPEHRRKGLARAALSALYHRMKPLGATHMTGGANGFYKKIGYEPAVTWTFWKRGTPEGAK